MPANSFAHLKVGCIVYSRGDLDHARVRVAQPLRVTALAAARSAQNQGQHNSLRPSQVSTGSFHRLESIAPSHWRGAHSGSPTNQSSAYASVKIRRASFFSIDHAVNNVHRSEEHTSEL